MPRVLPPLAEVSRLTAPIDASRWAPVPEISGSAPFSARPEEAIDALAGLEACAVADVVFIRQPSLEEAAQALRPCLEAVSKRYGAAAVLSIEKNTLLIRLPATAAHGPLARDLGHSLKARSASLLGHPVIVRADLASLDPRGVSVLQPVLERCAGPKMLPKDAAAFVEVYGDCLTREKGLGITAVKAHPSDPRVIVIYSGVRLESLHDMTGVVSVPAGSFRIEARRELSIPSAPIS